MNQDSGTETDGPNRRTLLKTLGAGAAGLVVASGSASAHKTQFFGCSQVCAGTAGDYAVVAREGSYHCRGLTTADRSDRKNLAFEATGKCYEVDEGAIVGILEQYKTGDGTECKLCLNPNRCAQNYYDDPEDIVDALNGDGACGDCLGNVELSDDCTVYQSNGRPGGADLRSEDEDEAYDVESEDEDHEDDEEDDEEEHEDEDEAEHEEEADDDGNEREHVEEAGEKTGHGKGKKKGKGRGRD